MPELLRPRSIDEAADLIGTHGAAAAVLAGGTSLLRETHPSDDGYLIGVDRLGLDRVEAHDGGWSVGAAVTLGALRAAVPVPALQAATHEVGGPAVQNMATVGGNLFARAPFGDLAPALLALGACVVFATAEGEVEQPIEAFYDAWTDGTPPRAGLLTRIELAAPTGTAAYLKMRPPPLCEPRSGHGRRLGRERGRNGDRCAHRAERRERTSMPLRRGGAGGDRLQSGPSGGDGGGRGGRGGRLPPDRPGRDRVVSPAHDRRLRRPRAGGARLTVRSGRQGWKPS